MFAILSGFILARVVKQYTTENRLFISIEDTLVRICNYAKKNKGFIHKIDNYMNFLMERNSKFESFSLQEQINFEEIHQRFINNIRNSIHNLSDSRKSTTGDLYKEIHNLEDKISEWRYLKGTHVSIFEWLILTALVGMAIILFYQIRSDTLFYQIVTIVFSCSLILCLLVIRDYDLRRPREIIRFHLLTQKISNILSQPPYLPREIFDIYFFGLKKLIGLKLSF